MAISVLKSLVAVSALVCTLALVSDCEACHGGGRGRDRPRGRPNYPQQSYPSQQNYSSSSAMSGSTKGTDDVPFEKTLTAEEQAALDLKAAEEAAAKKAAAAAAAMATAQVLAQEAANLQKLVDQLRHPFKHNK
jgi:hypothetical protein